MKVFNNVQRLTTKMFPQRLCRQIYHNKCSRLVSKKCIRYSIVIVCMVLLVEISVCTFLLGFHNDNEDEEECAKLKNNPTEANRSKWRLVPKVHLHSENLLYVIVVETSRQHVQQRQLLREIYAPRLRQNNATLLFVIREDPLKNKIQRRLESESRKTQDIMQFTLQEHNANPLLKPLIWLRFLYDSIATLKYVLKIDDNILFDVQTLLRIFKATDTEKSPSALIICNETNKCDDEFQRCQRIRDKSKMSNGRCSDGIYALNIAIVPKLLKAANNCQPNNMSENTYITSYLANKINVAPISFEIVALRIGEQYRSPLFVKTVNLINEWNLWNNLTGYSAPDSGV